MPDVAAVEIEQGREPPLPDFIPYLSTAERWSCPPTELIDGTGPPKWWWMRATLVLARAEGEASRRRAASQRR